MRAQLKKFRLAQAYHINDAVHKAGDDEAVAMLPKVLLRLRGGVNAALDARELHLRARVQITDVFLVERTNILVLNLLDERAVPACIHHRRHSRI